MHARTRLLVAALTVVALTARCAPAVAVRVNDVAIPMSAVDEQVERMKARSPELYSGEGASEAEAQLRSAIVEGLISGELLRQGAASLGVSVSDAEVDERFAAFRAGFTDEAALADALKREGLTEEALREQLRDQLLLQKVTDTLIADLAVSDVDIQRFYDDNPTRFVTPGASRVAHILFASGDRAGAAAALTEPGDVSAIVETTEGLHVITLLERRAESRKTLAEASPEIRQILVRQQSAEAYSAWLGELRGAAVIEYVGVPAPSGAK